MGALIAFPVAAVTVSFEDGWAARKGQMKTRGDGKEKTRKLWNKHAKIVGQDRLLAALKRYLKEEKEPTCGYPGLSVWLNGERYDHWMETTDSAALVVEGVTRPQFPLEAIRNAAIASLGLPWVLSYLDRCEVAESDAGPVLVVSSPTAKSRLYERRNELKALGLYGIRLRL